MSIKRAFLSVLSITAVYCFFSFNNVCLNDSYAIVAKPIITPIPYQPEFSIEDPVKFEFDDQTGTLKRVTGTAENIEIPSEINGVKVTAIGELAFNGHYYLKKLKIPDTVTSIGSSAFWNCENLVDINLPDSVTSIGDNAFSKCTRLKRITIPTGVTIIEPYTFSECTKLAEVIIPYGVTTIKYCAFFKCASLFAIKIPDSVISIEEKAFYACEKLESIKIPYSVSSISNELFAQCSSLTSVYIFGNLMSIGDYAFNYCSNLKFIYFNGNVPGRIGTQIFGHGTIEPLPSDVIIYYSYYSRVIFPTNWCGYRTEMTYNIPQQNSGCGDVNGDGTIDSADYAFLRRYLLGKIDVLPAKNWKRDADLNRDDVVDSADFLVLQRYLLKKIYDLPSM